MAGFFTRLAERCRRANSLLCVGLDPHPADLPAPATARAARDFCLRLIEATADVAAAFKPNAAFFEAFGAEGWAALQEVIAAVPAGIPVVLDAKRGDIASTAEAYARAAFEMLGADAITLNPYLGRDSLAPFLADPQRGVFLLAKTSNPGAADLQDLPVAGPTARLLWEKVVELARAWNERDNLGLVIGATYPDALRRARELAPELWILAPGVGAQGGDLSAALRAGARDDGLGLLVPISRAIARSDDPRRAAHEIVAAMRTYLAGIPSSGVTTPPLAGEIPMPRPAPRQTKTSGQSAVGGRRSLFSGREGMASSPFTEKGDGGSGEKDALADALLEAGCVRFGEFTLKSGLRSPIYLDLRLLISAPGLLAQVANAYVAKLRELQFDRLAALPYAALPIATAIALQTGWPLIYPRKEAKAYGTAAAIEGAYAAGERVVVIDDLATTGGSKFEAIDKLKAAGLIVEDVVVLVDRQSGAAEALAAAGYRLHAVLTLSEMLDHWEQTGRVPADQIAATREFMKEASAVRE
ncbi:MAG: orotidine-5'-phosphate decarboxylase [Anaerolineae bacterium]